MTTKLYSGYSSILGRWFCCWMSSMLSGCALKVSSRSFESSASGLSMSSQNPSVCASAKHLLTAAMSVVSVLPLVVSIVLIVETIVHGSTIHLRVRRRRPRLPRARGGPSRALPPGTGDQPCLLPWLQSSAHRESRFLLGRGFWGPESLFDAARRSLRNARNSRSHGGGRRLGAAVCRMLRSGDG